MERPSDSLVTWTKAIYGLHAFSLVGLWFIYRIVRGWLALSDSKPMYS